MVWPSVEETQDLVRDFFALQEFERIKNKTSLESYLMKKTRKVEEKLMKIREKKKEYTFDQFMVLLNHGRFTQYLPIHDPPVNMFDAETKDLITTINDVFMIRDGQDDERSGNTYDASKRISICNVIRDNQSHYLMDQWVFASSEPLSLQIDHTIEMGKGSYNENPYVSSYRYAGEILIPTREIHISQ
ncbi:unnamed protein product [Arabis nemorensis]|uniref:Uncharacterized protein n=1 Tax=Arabis nemorensis TaxID=586526 RepID=A0A565BK76_9BRAS|nr:unnamed protein product [Arabis nemorensis]